MMYDLVPFYQTDFVTHAFATSFFSAAVNALSNCSFLVMPYVGPKAFGLPFNVGE